MKKIVLFLALSCGLLFAGFHSFDGVVAPENKLDHALSKIWKDKAISLYQFQQQKINFCQQEALVFAILSNTDSMGFVVVSRVNSCRSGGCNIENDEAAISFEFFDYFIITDMNMQVLKVNVYNYQATQGHEVMSKGWLRQFIGFSGKEKLVYGKDIEAISGATVSAVAITDDIYATLDCLKNQLP